MFKIFGICICVLICTLIVGQYSKPIALTISFAGVVIAFLSLWDKVSSVVDMIKNIAYDVPASQEYIKIMLKVLCVVLVSQIISNLCCDNGESTLATATEISAKITVIVLVMPMFEVIISILNGLVK